MDRPVMQKPVIPVKKANLGSGVKPRTVAAVSSANAGENHHDYQINNKQIRVAIISFYNFSLDRFLALFVFICVNLFLFISLLISLA
jgi:uncharacterized membrane protein